jgi:hypothetical protein
MLGLTAVALVHPGVFASLLQGWGLGSRGMSLEAKSLSKKSIVGVQFKFVDILLSP